MSKQQALEGMSARAERLMRGDLRMDDGSREDVVRAWQTINDLKPDGWPGERTLSALWHNHKPSADDILDAAHVAQLWPPVVYSMGRNTGMGEAWLPDNSVGYETGDCSDFVCHCLGVTKDQMQGRTTLKAAAVWLGADAIAAGRIGKPRPLTEAAPGDIIAYPGKWERGERLAVGHVEVCVEVAGEGKGRRVITIGCASGNGKRKSRYDKPKSAIARADKTDLWRRKSAVAVRPWWLA